MINVEVEGRLLTLTLNRPEKANALNRLMLEEMDACIMQAEAKGVRALIITGAGNVFLPGPIWMMPASALRQIRSGNVFPRESPVALPDHRCPQRHLGRRCHGDGAVLRHPDFRSANEDLLSGDETRVPAATVRPAPPVRHRRPGPRQDDPDGRQRIDAAEALAWVWWTGSVPPNSCWMRRARSPQMRWPPRPTTSPPSSVWCPCTDQRVRIVSPG